MGTSTNAIIAFGIQLEEGFEFPWDDENDENDCVDWWRELNNYNNPYDWKIDKDYWKYQNEWDKENPIPFEIENYCSQECPMYILAVKGTVKTAERGYPNDFNPNDLKVDPESLNIFKRFIDKYKISDENPKWLIFSYWG